MNPPRSQRFPVEQRTEDKVRKWVLSKKDLHVYAGPLYMPETEADSKKYVKYQAFLADPHDTPCLLALGPLPLSPSSPDALSPRLLSLDEGRILLYRLAFLAPFVS
jgi:hypothetical protein